MKILLAPLSHHKSVTTEASHFTIWKYKEAGIEKKISMKSMDSYTFKLYQSKL